MILLHIAPTYCDTDMQLTLHPAASHQFPVFLEVVEQTAVRHVFEDKSIWSLNTNTPHHLHNVDVVATGNLLHHVNLVEEVLQCLTGCIG